jgi:hypothetical protein
VPPGSAPAARQAEPGESEPEQCQGAGQGRVGDLVGRSVGLGCKEI